MYCDWTINVESTLGNECKGGIEVGSPVSLTVAIVLIITCALGKYKTSSDKIRDSQWRFAMLRIL